MKDVLDYDKINDYLLAFGFKKHEDREETSIIDKDKETDPLILLREISTRYEKEKKIFEVVRVYFHDKTLSCYLSSQDIEGRVYDIYEMSEFITLFKSEIRQLKICSILEN